MPIEGLKGIYRIPLLEKKKSVLKRKKKKQKQNEKKDENGPETSETDQKHIDIKA